MTIIGLMSGTSMDGVDLICANYHRKNGHFNFDLLHSSTVPYSKELAHKLEDAICFSAVELLKLDKELGRFYGNCINDFCVKNKINKSEIACIASHGHTVHHQPENGFTLQIGCGTSIAITTGINVVNDFRTKDVVLGGQGAPLVPIGDQLLFAQYAQSFLNLGGFSNLSILKQFTVAYDVCPCNLILNFLAKKIGLSYDKDGLEAQKGIVHEDLLAALNSLPYYAQKHPKSLGAEFLEEHLLPRAIRFDLPIQDLLRTFTEHIAFQISCQFNEHSIESVYVSGGGAKNTFLMERIVAMNKNISIIVPSNEIIDYKEAIIFGLLGALYLNDLPNTIPSVTGAKRAGVGGVFHTAK